MCKDIKMLDTAKNNLATSICTLKKFSDLLRGLDNIESFMQSNNFKEAGDAMLGVKDMIEYFKPYESIP